MNQNELYHFGIIGMKWGIRRFQPYPKGSKRHGKEVGEAAKVEQRSDNASESSSRSVKDMSDDEIRALINRLQLENQYIQLITPKAPEKKKSTARRAIDATMRASGDILLSSYKNLGTQAVVYLVGTGINKAAKKKFGEDILNPKKGQKDK